MCQSTIVYICCWKTKDYEEGGCGDTRVHAHNNNIKLCLLSIQWLIKFEKLIT